MRTITVDLVDGFEWHGEKVGTLPIRAPNGQQHALYGEPRILVYNPDGAGYYVDQPAVIRQYTEALVKHEGGADILPLLTLADSMIVRGAIIDFLRRPRRPLRAKSRRARLRRSGPELRRGGGDDLRRDRAGFRSRGGLLQAPAEGR